jgi:hypothetical protein
LKNPPFNPLTNSFKYNKRDHSQRIQWKDLNRADFLKQINHPRMVSNTLKGNLIKLQSIVKQEGLLENLYQLQNRQFCKNTINQRYSRIGSIESHHLQHLYRLMMKSESKHPLHLYKKKKLYPKTFIRIKYLNKKNNNLHMKLKSLLLKVLIQHKPRKYSHHSLRNMRKRLKIMSLNEFI